MLDVARKFASSVLPEIIRPLRVLWNELIAFLFLVFFAVAAVAAWRSYQSSGGSAEGLGRAAVSGIFGLIMLVYGVQSYVRSRRVGRPSKQ
ncbi:MAG: hypothetical protein R2762_11560 [Bryobacteraceae bacterium]